MMHRSLLPAAALAALLAGIHVADAASNRGTAGSAERTNWCRDKLSECNSAAEETCTFNHPPGGARDACIDTRSGQCSSSYGSGSNCTTAARTGGAIGAGSTLKLKTK
jgi:hypothetical protein